MERDNDEGRGAVLVFDRDRLSMRYRLDLIDDSVVIAEHEERVSNRSIPLGAGLVGVVSQPMPTRCREERRHAWNGVPIVTKVTVRSGCCWRGRPCVYYAALAA